MGRFGAARPWSRWLGLACADYPPTTPLFLQRWLASANGASPLIGSLCAASCSAANFTASACASCSCRLSTVGLRAPRFGRGSKGSFKRCSCSLGPGLKRAAASRAFRSSLVPRGGSNVGVLGLFTPRFKLTPSRSIHPRLLPIARAGLPPRRPRSGGVLLLRSERLHFGPTCRVISGGSLLSKPSALFDKRILGIGELGLNSGQRCRLRQSVSLTRINWASASYTCWRSAIIVAICVKAGVLHWSRGLPISNSRRSASAAASLASRVCSSRLRFS